MIRHVAMFTWREGAPNEDISRFAAELSTMPQHVPGILRYEHGDDLQLGTGSSDYVLVADFATVEDFRAYSAHPYHVEFIETRVKPIVQAISRVQHHLP